MKIFVLSIFKCKKCPFNTTTSLKIDSFINTESDYKTEILKDFLTSQEGTAFLKKLQTQFEIITDNDIADCMNSENIRKILFEIDVQNGHLKCDKCGIIYPINEFILDTVDCIDPK